MKIHAGSNPAPFTKQKIMGKTLTFPANEMGDYILSEHGSPSDLDNNKHQGFTVGNGKKMYWYFIWHPSGNATIYDCENPMNKRYINGDQIITVHFNQ